MSELFQKYDYPLLIVSALIKIFNYEISITGWIIISEILYGTQQSNIISTFAWLFQTDQMVIF